MTVDNWAADTTNAVSELRVEVFYPVQGKERSVRLSTLVNPRAAPPATTRTPPAVDHAMISRRPPAATRVGTRLP